MDIHIITVTLKRSPENMDNKAVQLFQENGVGRTTHGAKGVLFLIDPTGKQVRIEIGYDLEPVFTDGFTGYMEKGASPLSKQYRAQPTVNGTLDKYFACKV